MPTTHKPRFGSLQFWPRKRADKILPRVNWKPLEQGEGKGLLGFIGYKAGMYSAIVKDNTPDSLTKGKQIIFPVTIVECPPMKVFSVRFYKNNLVSKDIIAPEIDKEKELKRKLYLPKKAVSNINDIKLNDYDNIRLIVFSLVKSTGIKKTPDIAEIGLKGTIEEKFEIAKNLLGKEIKVEDIVEKSNNTLDIHSVTIGKGFQGPVKRFGISLKQHKTEKGTRRPGSLGPWVPKKVTFRAPMAGQLGFFTRVQYNNKIIDLNNIAKKNINPKSGFMNYGIVKNSYLIIKGSIGGPVKRVLMLTKSLRPRKRREKENFELLKLE